MSLKIDRDPRVLEAVRELAPAGGDRFAALETIQAACGHATPGKTAVNLKGLVKGGWVERVEDFETGLSGYRAKDTEPSVELARQEEGIRRTGADGPAPAHEPSPVLWDSDREKGKRLG